MKPVTTLQMWTIDVLNVQERDLSLKGSEESVKEEKKKHVV